MMYIGSIDEKSTFVYNSFFFVWRNLKAVNDKQRHMGSTLGFEIGPLKGSTLGRHRTVTQRSKIYVGPHCIPTCTG